MFIYLGVFFTSTILLYIASKSKDKTKVAFFSILGLLLPCLLAGLRADTIGTDVNVYVKSMYLSAKESHSFADYYQKSWFHVWHYLYVYEYEIGFSLLIYVVTKIFGSLAAVLFFIELSIIVPIYCGLLKYKNKYPIWMSMLIFYLMFYNSTYNIMRQWIAIAILFFAHRFIEEGKRKEYICAVLVAFLFHKTAILGIVLLLVYEYTVRYAGKDVRLATFYKLNKLTNVLKIAAIGMGALLLLDIAVYILRVVGFDKFVIYINGQFSILPNQFIVRLPLLMLFILYWKKIYIKEKSAPFLMAMLLIDIIVSQVTSINPNASRITLFFSQYALLSYPVIYASEKRKSNRRLLGIAIVGFLILYWLYYSVIKGANETVPYEFFFLQDIR